MILFGHQTGNPNSHHAALAHYERNRLAAFVVPWFPGMAALKGLHALPASRSMARRLSRRRFEPLAGARLVQGRAGEFRRLLLRAAGRSDGSLNYEVNDWLMHRMQGIVGNNEVSAVHSPEDASLLQFEEAKRRGKACIYDMPTCAYPWWKSAEARIMAKYGQCAPTHGVEAHRWVRPDQKALEVELADLVLVPSHFVEKTIREFYPDKRIALAPYGVDAGFWAPRGENDTATGPRDYRTTGRRDQLRFIYAGGCSIRKGIPVLLEAWEKAQLRDAELTLVGSWQLAEGRLKRLPRGVKFVGPVGPEQLRELYRGSDVFVFPSFADGFGLVILEAMACGLPVIVSDCSAGPDVSDESCGRVVAAGDLEQSVEAFRWFAVNRGKLPAMKKAARAKAKSFTWEKYRAAVSEAVAPFVGP